ncbi:hypothetical protein HYALB_00003770 [Hymenoscyphus albidus]|uniref:Uncharacterized protein n=1 Tax=Hymenoscyphus albidus TaxID=595503 RepID=A0A9N9M0K4_9HELO|nr:hypothetical protein HYALB_00003770 [Hymenoscyphus albidus]
MTEVAIYLWYFWVLKTQGERMRVGGRAGGQACVLGLIGGTVTLTKSSLYSWYIVLPQVI